MKAAKSKISVIKKFNHLPLDSKLRTILTGTILPLGILVIILLTAMMNNSEKYDQIAKNLTIASEFSFDFKNNIDYKAYRYVIIKKDFESFEMLQDVDHARGVVERLQESTVNPDSLSRLRLINQDLDKLEDGLIELRDNKGYDFLMKRLDINVRVLTTLIQDKILEYVYFETANLDKIIYTTKEETSKVILIMSVVSIALVVFIFLLATRISRSVTKPIKELSENIRMVGQGDFTVRPVSSVQTDEIRALSETFDSMVEEIKDLMENVRKEQDNLRVTEFKLMQAQINPHFLYNTLDTVIWLVQDKQNEQVNKIITSLSSFFRTTLSNGRDIITVREETIHIRSYLEIQQIRYRDLLTYEIDIPKEMEEFEIPKLTLQPLVENALYHGIKLKRSLGKIRISGEIKEDELCFSVWDNGIGMKAEELEKTRKSISSKDKQSFGLPNVHERLQMYYGDEYKILVESVFEEYTCFKITIPSKEIQPYE